VITDYHSPDSISLLLDNGEAIIGDLPPEGQMLPDDQHAIRNWDLLRKMGARDIYPSHAMPFHLEENE